MHFTFDKTSTPVVTAEAYLACDKRLGHTFRMPHLDLSFYGIGDCLCFGKTSQAVTALEKTGKIPCVFAESCQYRVNEPALAEIVSGNLNSPVVELDEAAPFYPPGADNFWHWTVESLPRLLALEEIGYTGHYILPAAPDGKSGADSPARQSLRMFGIDESRLLCSGPTYRIKRLILPQHFSGFWMAENMALAGFLREKLLEAAGTAPGKRRLYVKRIGQRRIANETEVVEVLEDFGFATMVPEEYPLAEQWRAMTNVECSVMAHGSNSTLTLLQPPGSAAVEFFNSRYISYNNLHAARLLKLRYRPVVEEFGEAFLPEGGSPSDEPKIHGLSADITVDPLHLRIALEELLN